MKKETTLKKQILIILISFSIFIAVSVGLISMINFYFTKLDIIEHNQKQILFQIESEIDKFLSKIYKISFYIKNNYSENSNLLKNIVDNINSNPFISNKNTSQLKSLKIKSFSFVEKIIPFPFSSA